MAASASTAVRPRGVSAVRRVALRPQFWFGLCVLVPCMAWYAVFVYKPVVMGVQLSFEHYVAANPAATTFVGLANFQALFEYSLFWTALWHTVAYSVGIYVISVPTALLVASCITTVKRGRRFYEFVVFLPVVASLVAVCVVFRMLMNPQSGAFDVILRTLHLPTSQFINGESSALASVVMVDAWKGLGFYVVILTAAMLGVPETLYDAARIDGARGWQIFRNVTLPGIMPTLALVSIMAIIGGLQVYVTPVVLGPGPGNSTMVLNQFIVSEAFTSFNLGLATSASLVLFVIILGITILQMRVLRPRFEGGME